MFGTNDINVTENRHLYVGGSDIPTILGINKYQSAFQLAKEKLRITPSTFTGNEYTVYGQTMEPQIREYINAVNEVAFIPDTTIDQKHRLRGNCDGLDRSVDLLLEIKTHGKNLETKGYIAQMQLYMYMFNVTAGWLALYERPADFDAEFDSDRLTVEVIERDDEQIRYILQAVETFWKRCEALKDNPDMSETEFLEGGVNELTLLVGGLEKLELELHSYKQLEERYKAMKERLYELMEKHDVKSLSTVNLSITRVLPTTSSSFDRAALKKEHPELEKKYTKTSPKKGFVKITMREQKEEAN